MVRVSVSTLTMSRSELHSILLQFSLNVAVRVLMVSHEGRAVHMVRLPRRPASFQRFTCACTLRTRKSWSLGATCEWTKGARGRMGPSNESVDQIRSRTLSEMQFRSSANTRLECAIDPLAGLPEALGDEAKREDDQHHDHAAVLGHDLCARAHGMDRLE